MKRMLLMLLCLSVVLTGCGTAAEDMVSEITDSPAAAEPEETAAEEITELPTEAPTEPPAESPTEPPATEAPEEASTEPPTEAPTEEFAELPTDAPVEPPAASPSRESIIMAYKTAIQDKISIAGSYTSMGNFLVSYVLYDMDHDSIPELLVKYGTCEADYQIAVYTYRNDALKLVEDGLGGGHTSLCYDYVARQLVLAYGHMGYGEMSWYDLDENGDLRFLISSGSFEFAGEDGLDFEDYMNKYNVAWLDECTFFGTDTTWISTFPGGVYQFEEYSGFDYRYLENYPF